MPVQAQRIFVESAREAGGKITLREIESGHSPMLSRPEETVVFKVEAVASFAEE